VTHCGRWLGFFNIASKQASKKLVAPFLTLSNEFLVLCMVPRCKILTDVLDGKNIV
jgi:hypothetical protein